jgi:alkylation response protein AidB-like acyl-CoA dehydrogenase
VDFEFTEEQELFRKAVREWCEKNLPIEKIREMDTKGAIPQELLRSMGEMGLNIMTAPPRTWRNRSRLGHRMHRSSAC